MVVTGRPWGLQQPELARALRNNVSWPRTQLIHLECDVVHIARAGPALGPTEQEQAGNNFLTQAAGKLAACGVNLWANEWPDPRGRDYWYNPKQLPQFWGIAEGELCEDRRHDVLTRFRKA